MARLGPEEVTEIYLLGPIENQHSLTHTVQVSLTGIQSPSANEGLEPDLPSHILIFDFCNQAHTLLY